MNLIPGTTLQWTFKDHSALGCLHFNCCQKDPQRLGNESTDIWKGLFSHGSYVCDCTTSVMPYKAVSNFCWISFKTKKAQWNLDFILGPSVCAFFCNSMFMCQSTGNKKQTGLQEQYFFFLNGGWNKMLQVLRVIPMLPRSYIPRVLCSPTGEQRTLFLNKGPMSPSFPQKVPMFLAL